MDQMTKNSLLIIDDSQFSSAVLTNILNQEYIVYRAENGRDGIESAKENLPDVIILDIEMPKMDGYETISELKNTEQTRRIPVLFITGHSDVATEEKGLALGAADYISKPFSAEIVKLRVGNQIRMLNYLHTIEHMSMTDQLTNLPNRRSFNDRLSAEWKRAKRMKVPISILLIDIDNFKKYNDTYGHQQGDVVLQSVSKEIARTLKRPSDFAARWGGEEFIVLLPDTNQDGAVTIAEQIRKNVEAVTVDIVECKAVHVTVSLGANAQIPADDYTSDDFIHHADDALYMAKAAGRNRVCRHNGI